MAWTPTGNIQGADGAKGDAGDSAVVTVLGPADPIPAETPAGLIVRLAED